VSDEALDHVIRTAQVTRSEYLGRASCHSP